MEDTKGTNYSVTMQGISTTGNIVVYGDQNIMVGCQNVAQPSSSSSHHTIRRLDFKPTRCSPHASVNYFVGREDDLHKIHSIFQAAVDEKLPLKKIVVIHGRGGQGKSELAKQFVSRCKNGLFIKEPFLFTEGYIFWINCETFESLRKDFVTLAKELWIDLDEGPHQAKDVGDICKRIYQKLSDESKKSLFIFDNVEQWFYRQQPKEGATASLFGISIFVPCQELALQPAILITSRSASFGSHPIIKLCDFHENETIQLFAKKLILSNSMDVDISEAIRKIHDYLHGFPLAVNLTASWVHQMSGGGQIKVRLLKCMDEWIAKFKGSSSSWMEFQSEYDDANYDLIMSNVWEGTVRAIKNHKSGLGGQAINLLYELAYLDPNFISIELANYLYSFNSKHEGRGGGGGDSHLVEILGILELHSMIHIQDNKFEIYHLLDITIHRLVQKCLQQWRGGECKNFCELLKKFNGLDESSDGGHIRFHVKYLMSKVAEEGWPLWVIPDALNCLINLCHSGRVLTMEGDVKCWVTHVQDKVTRNRYKCEAEYVAVQLLQIYVELRLKKKREPHAKVRVDCTVLKNLMKEWRMTKEELPQWILTQMKKFEGSKSVINVGSLLLSQVANEFSIFDDRKVLADAIDIEPALGGISGMLLQSYREYGQPGREIDEWATGRYDGLYWDRIMEYLICSDWVHDDHDGFAWHLIVYMGRLREEMSKELTRHPLYHCRFPNCLDFLRKIAHLKGSTKGIEQAWASDDGIDVMILGCKLANHGIRQKTLRSPRIRWEILGDCTRNLKTLPPFLFNRLVESPDFLKGIGLDSIMARHSEAMSYRTMESVVANYCSLLADLWAVHCRQDVESWRLFEGICHNGLLKFLKVVLREPNESDSSDDTEERVSLVSRTFALVLAVLACITEHDDFDKEVGERRPQSMYCEEALHPFRDIMLSVHLMEDIQPIMKGRMALEYFVELHEKYLPSKDCLASVAAIKLANRLLNAVDCEDSTLPADELVDDDESNLAEPQDGDALPPDYVVSNVDEELPPDFKLDLGLLATCAKLEKLKLQPQFHRGPPIAFIAPPKKKE